MRVYISGKITGLEYSEVERLFNAAEKKLSKNGFTPVNPLRNNLPMWASWREHMKKDIQILLSCDAIFMLDNWKDSKGATLERHIAEQLGMIIFGQLRK